jgi:hypothetical protein
MKPISLHPDNPRYFLFRGKPAVLITSGEHYGAVLNRDFDYLPYLDELGSRDFNLTRLFSGAYVENPGAFNISHNTLAPLPGRFLCPWARSSVPGYAGGGAKFDLHTWDPEYFSRLREFVAQAGKRGIVVEMVLFCPYYEEAMWSLSPLKAGNNVNGVGDVPRTEALTLKHPELVAVEEALARKLAKELQPFDNVYYEVCNEPYFGGVTLEWQNRIIAAVADSESGRSRHLIAQNIANGSQKVEAPNAAVSVFNFHYASPPDAVTVNAALQKVIGFDETGFRGTADLPYRTDAWSFLMAGGAVYSNLDYSFTAEHPDGSAPIPETTPGGGGPYLRSQLKILKGFIESFDFPRMKPDAGVIKGGVPAGATARALSEPGEAYAVYVQGGERVSLSLDVPAGFYLAEWVNPRTGGIDKREDLEHKSGALTLASPRYTEDVALRLLAVDENDRHGRRRKA